jgi:hypothetical protein
MVREVYGWLDREKGISSAPLAHLHSGWLITDDIPKAGNLQVAAPHTYCLFLKTEHLNHGARALSFPKETVIGSSNVLTAGFQTPL